MNVRAAFFAACVGLVFTSITPVSYSEPARLKVRMTVFSPDGSTKEAIEEFKAEKLVGDYRLGDGLGHNLHLILKDNGTFQCTWSGCLGIYGTASGKWAVEEIGLKLTPQKFDGTLKDRPLDRLRVISFQKNYLLLPEKDLDWFKKHGPDTICCFHQKVAREALEQRYHRRLEATVEAADKKFQEKSKK